MKPGMSTIQNSFDKRESPLRIGIDIGGTFTDFVIFDPKTKSLSTFKVPSTPNNPAEAVLKGLLEWFSPDKPPNISITHGSTVATNALLERKGAYTALVTTRGFRDIIEIGRQDRPLLYDITPKTPPPLIPESLRFEVDERVDYRGEVLVALESSQVDNILVQLDAAASKDDHPQSVESIAICFLFSFLNPDHESMVAEKLRSAGYFVSPSHEILPEFREYERTATTVVNAFVSPIMDRYLTKLEKTLPKVPLQVMQSNGGVISPTQARQQAVRCILSGPAGGVVGAQQVAVSAATNIEKEKKKIRGVLTFDMGGTSTDVSLIVETPKTTTEAVIGGFPIRVPILDIHTIGAGGGSIAHIDAGGILRVGPQSAGADPGPACYGVGDLVTVTDANLHLGRLLPDHFLGGEIELYPERAAEVIATLASHLNLTPIETSLGIIEIANAHMARALRVISVERGHDPSDFTLISFGGAGGLHAADLARTLGIPRMLVSPFAATFSALGMLMADIVKDYTQTIMLPGDTDETELVAQISPLLERGRTELITEGVSENDIRLEPQLDVRYRGQSYEIVVPFTSDWKTVFRRQHQTHYGYYSPDAPIEIVNIRVRAVGSVPSPEVQSYPSVEPDPGPALMQFRTLTLSSGPQEVPFYQGDRLQPGHQIPGPAIIIRSDTTILLGTNDQATIDSYLNVLIEISSDHD